MNMMLAIVGFCDFLSCTPILLRQMALWQGFSCHQASAGLTDLTPKFRQVLVLYFITKIPAVKKRLMFLPRRPFVAMISLV